MRELDGLRAALAGLTVGRGSKLLINAPPTHEIYRDHDEDGDTETVALVRRKEYAPAIVSAVNLAAPLAAVAEAAEALLPELDTDPGTRGAALRDAVDTLKAAAASKEGA